MGLSKDRDNVHQIQIKFDKYRSYLHCHLECLISSYLKKKKHCKSAKLPWHHNILNSCLFLWRVSSLKGLTLCVCVLNFIYHLLIRIQSNVEPWFQEKHKGAIKEKNFSKWRQLSRDCVELKLHPRREIIFLNLYKSIKKCSKVDPKMRKVHLKRL